MIPIRKWSKAAKQMLREAIIFLGLILFVSPAWAVSGAGLDSLTQTIIQAESSGNPLAIGPTGERGLMQISEATWEAVSRWPWRDAFDPEKNVQVGRQILEVINQNYDERATCARIVYTYNTGRYCFRTIPAWTRKHPNKIYRRIFCGV